jgi:SNF2 family DNA or RNA helicase
MLLLQAIWSGDRIHIWSVDSPAPAQCNPSSAPTEPQLLSFSSYADLRTAAGDLWDSLLVSTAQNSELTLYLPDRRNAPGESAIDSSEPGAPATGGTPTSDSETAAPESRIPTLALAPADAVDLFASANWHAQTHAAPGASMRFWAAAARLTLDILARQRFVPDVERVAPDQYRAHWRPAPEYDQIETMKRLAQLMPRVCLATLPPQQRSAHIVLEHYVAGTVDALVRQTLAGDELTHGILGDPSPNPTLLARWLRSLLGTESAVSGSSAETTAIYHKVREWIARLEPPSSLRTCRLHLALTAPEDLGGPAAGWKLEINMQSSSDPELLIPIAELDKEAQSSRLVPTPFQNAREQLRSDLETASKAYPPLAVFLEPDADSRITLTTQEAYTFLRDALPLLELEGIGVSPPPWWRQDRPRLRMRLDLRPAPSAGGDTDGSMRLDSLVVYDWRIALGEEDLSPEEIAALALANEPIVRLRGRWTEIQPTEVQAAARFRANNPGGAVKLFEALRQCYMADDLETGLAVAGIRGEGWVERVLNAGQWHEDESETIDAPSTFHGELRPYQLRGLRWMNFMSRLGLGACLADDMGLGKTIQLISLLLQEKTDAALSSPTLLVVPMSLVGNWRREIERFGPSLKVMVHHGLERRSGESFLEEARSHDVVICTYALVHRDFEHLSAMPWHRVALDEAQNIKNPAAKQAAAVRSLRSVHRIALTGTPVENRLSELWSIFNFLIPGYLGTAPDFRRRFAVPIERHHDTDRAARLRDLIRPFILRRLKSDPTIQVDLPPKMEMKVFCNLTREQAGLYEAVVQEVMGRIESADGIQRRGLILAALTRLKQICNHPAHFLGDASSLPHRSGKCERLVEMLEEVLAEGDHALVFTQYRQMGTLLHKLITSTFDRDVLFLHGGTPRHERDALVERFQRGQHDAPIFILSLKAGGFGLNLTAANHVFHFDRWWNPAVEDQATDRTHRIGQNRAVQVHKFVCIGTLEERIDAMLMNKRSLAENIIGAGEQWITELSTSALRELFVLSREDAVGDE